METSFSLSGLILSAVAIAGVSLLWRTYRYDDENPLNKYLDRLPYLPRKSITCGICFTFWVAFLFAIIFEPLQGFLPENRFDFSLGTLGMLEFIFSWMVLGSLSALLVYLIETLFQVSHYYKHESQTSHHEHKK